MSPTQKKAFKTLKQIYNQFDEVSCATKSNCLKTLVSLPLNDTKVLTAYHEILLYMMAHPSSKKERLLVAAAIKRLAQMLSKKSATFKEQLLNSGLPFVPVVTRFSHDMNKWLLAQPAMSVTLDAFTEPILTLNEVLKHTLPSIERTDTTAGLSNTDLLETLGVPQHKQLSFIVNEVNRLSTIPFIKDQLFEGLNIYTRLTPHKASFSIQGNTLRTASLFYHKELVKKFDHLKLLHTPVPEAIVLSDVQRKEVVNVIKQSLVLTARETDPSTYMDEHTLRLYELERGITVAIYGMEAQRQLPLESYIGYTLFKNGYPAAYGGGWVFGKRSHFGINIFEWFRGGESAYMCCQLLRVYRQVFGVDYFEVEPYQYGLDNPEGIASGAFWFYYRFGFRPLDQSLRQLAEKEYQKIQTKKGYRSSEKTLIRFTESNIALNLGTSIPLTAYEITTKLRQLINQQYRGNRLLAEEQMVKNFLQNCPPGTEFNQQEMEVMKEVAMMSAVVKWSKSHQLQFIEIIKQKPVNPYRYQEMLLKLIR